MKARCITVGIVELPDGKNEVRFRRDVDESQWIPEVLINHETGAMSPPPKCFTPTPGVIVALDRAYSEGA